MERRVAGSGSPVQSARISKDADIASARRFDFAIKRRGISQQNRCNQRFRCFHPLSHHYLSPYVLEKPHPTPHNAEVSATLQAGVAIARKRPSGSPPKCITQPRWSLLRGGRLRLITIVPRGPRQRM